MEFISAILSYISFIIYNFSVNLLDLVPLWSIFSLLEKFNATLPIDGVATLIFWGTSSDSFWVRLLSVILMLSITLLAFGISIWGIKYLYGNIADFLFKFKYKWIDDKETSEMIEQNVFEKWEQFNKNKLKFNYKGFTGVILSRLHAWKENKLKLDNNAEGNNVRTFGVLTFTLIYLFGFMNRKEIKEYKYYGMIVAVIATIITWSLIFNSSNFYNFKILAVKNNNTINEQIPNPYKLDSNNVNAPKIVREDTNITISKFSDVMMLSILNVLTSNYKDVTINNNWVNWASFSDIKNSLIREFVSILWTIKTDPTLYKIYKQDKVDYPDIVNSYMNNKITEEQLKTGLKDINYMTLLFMTINTHKIELYKSLGTDTIWKDINALLWDTVGWMLNMIYKWKEYRSIYKVVNENKWLILTQKFIYDIWLVPLVKSETLVTLEQAKKNIGILPPVLEKQVQENNNNILLWNDTIAKKNSEQATKNLWYIHKMLSKKTGTGSTEDNWMYVVNPNYVYKIFGLFPVYPLSTNKSVDISYYLFLLILAFIQFWFLLLFMWLWRFIYLYLTYTMLDNNQKSNYEIDWRVEATDTLIRIVFTLFVYLYLVNTIMLFKIT